MLAVATIFFLSWYTPADVVALSLLTAESFFFSEILIYLTLGGESS